jgi:hypothetical protein
MKWIEIGYQEVWDLANKIWNEAVICGFQVTQNMITIGGFAKARSKRLPSFSQCFLGLCPIVGQTHMVHENMRGFHQSRTRFFTNQHGISFNQQKWGVLGCNTNNNILDTVEINQSKCGPLTSKIGIDTLYSWYGCVWKRVEYSTPYPPVI